MIKGLYFFNGKDITMNMCIQIREVVHAIMEQRGMSFQEAVTAFYSSKTYEVMQNTENTLWAESAGYIADRYFDEVKMAVDNTTNLN